MSEIEILAFRAGTPASKGITAADLDDVIASYDPAAQTAPIVIGHPTNDAPAHGEISGVRRDGNDLFVKMRNLGTKVVEGVKKSELVNRSIAFWDKGHPSNPSPGKYSLRHFGFLGAATPGIPNLGKLTFSADDTEILVEGEPAAAVIFAVEEVPTPVTVITDPPAAPPAKPLESTAVPMTEAEIATAAAENARIAQANADEAARLATERATFAATQTAQREASNAAIVASLVASGHVAPTDQPKLAMAFNAIPADELTFSADDKGTAISAIASIIAKCGKVVPVGTTPTSPTGGAPEFSADANKAAADLALANANKAAGEAWRPQA